MKMNSKLLLCLALVLSGNCRAEIIFPPAPEVGWQCANNKLKTVMHATPNVFKGLTFEDLTTTNALKAYDFSPENVVSNNILSSAQFCGWQYLFAHGTNVLSVWLNINPKGGKPNKRPAVASGPPIQATLVALQKAEELPQVKKRDYECRFLTSPYLFSAIWLHAKSDDIIVMLPPPPWDKWNAYQAYTEGEVVRLLKPDVKQKIKMSKQYPHLPD